MTVQELLGDLATKDNVDYVSPELQFIEDKPGNCKLYKVHYREVDSTDNTAVYNSQSIYVVDEGLETEKAYYKDNIPTVRLKSVLTKAAAEVAEISK